MHIVRGRVGRKWVGGLDKPVRTRYHPTMRKSLAGDPRWKSRKLKNLKELKRALEFWVPVMGLSNWEIKVNFQREKDLPLNVVGLTDCSLDTQRRAKIALLDPSEFYVDDNYNSWEAFDLEYVLVHELSHVLMADAIPYDLYSDEADNPFTPWFNRGLENVVHQIALTFINLHRKEYNVKRNPPNTKRGSLLSGNKKTPRVVPKRTRKGILRPRKRRSDLEGSRKTNRGLSARRGKTK